VIADQLSKLYVRSNLALGQSLPEEGTVRLTHVANTGCVFGLAPDHALMLIIAAVIVIVGLLLCYRYFRFNNLCSQIAFGLLLGGSIGNLVDRIHLGYVTDFIDVQLWSGFHWPAFNLADSAIVIGVLFLLCLLFPRLKSARHQDDNTADSESLSWVQNSENERDISPYR
jgi:signal peptidase II